MKTLAERAFSSSTYSGLVRLVMRKDGLEVQLVYQHPIRKVNATQLYDGRSSRLFDKAKGLLRFETLCGYVGAV